MDTSLHAATADFDTIIELYPHLEPNEAIRAYILDCDTHNDTLMNIEQDR